MRSVRPVGAARRDSERPMSLRWDKGEEEPWGTGDLSMLQLRLKGQSRRSLSDAFLSEVDSPGPENINQDFVSTNHLSTYIELQLQVG